MNDFQILEARCAASDRAFGCGPIGGLVVAEVKLQNKAGECFYVSLAEMGDLPSFFRTEESTFQAQLDMDHKISRMLDEHCLTPGMDYPEILSDRENELNPVYRYLTWLVRCPAGEDEAFRKETEGNWLSRIEIPKSDVE